MNTPNTPPVPPELAIAAARELFTIDGLLTTYRCAHPGQGAEEQVAGIISKHFAPLREELAKAKEMNRTNYDAANAYAALLDQSRAQSARDADTIQRIHAENIDLRQRYSNWMCACKAQDAVVIKQRSSIEQVMREALRLADSIYKSEYLKDAPNWVPLDTIAGVISQIDNMYAGVREQRNEAKNESHSLRSQVEQMKAQLDAMRADRELQQKAMWEANDGRCEAMQRLASAEADKERLDWLQSTDGEVHSDLGYQGKPSTWYAYDKRGHLNDTPFVCFSGPTLRAAIDSARTPTPAGEQKTNNQE